MSFFFRKSGIVNVKMVITEEKILSNIDKIQKLINPNSKKQIVQLDDDSYFKDLVESVKTYLLEYPKKKNFPKSVYKSSYDLVEYATNQFEENTKRIEDLIRQRERNIKLGSVLRDATEAVKARAKNWKEIVKKIETKYPADVAEALTVIGKTKEKEKETSEEYKAAVKLIETKVGNLESNLHIEIDMERIEDRSKALSYIGIEIAEALKYIPAPIDEIEEIQAEQDIIQNIETTKVGEVAKEEPAVVEEKTAPVFAGADTNGNGPVLQTVSGVPEEENTFFEETRFEAKPSLWQRIKNSRFVQAIKYVLSIKVVLEYPALPEGRGENY